LTDPNYNEQEIQSAQELTEEVGSPLHPAIVADLSIENKLIDTGELLVKFQITNQSGKSIYVLVDNSPFETLCNDNFIVRLNRKRIAYRGPYAKRIRTNNKSFRRLEPGQSAMTEFDLFSYYPISSTGALSIELKTRKIRYSQHYPSEYMSGEKLCNSLTTPNLGRTKINTKISHNSKIRAINKSQATEETYYDLSYYDEVQKLVDPIIHIQSQGPKSLLRESHLLAYELILKCLDKINSSAALIEKWFGSIDHFDAIKTNFEKMKNHLENQVTVYAMGDHFCNCQSTSDEKCTMLAYTYKHQKNIYLCQLFFDEESNSAPERASTIIHELSHFVLDTDDHGKDKTDAENLAKKIPSEALKNADTYGFFCEEFYSECLPKSTLYNSSEKQ
jgi:hypothetical protein